MDLGRKLQDLRKRNGLTQEELAKRLFVSRTAVSKWESGRGFPSIESLKAISKLFSVSVDDLLSGDELVSIAEDDSRMKTNRIRSLVFGSIDVSMALLLFLPFFRMNDNGAFSAVPLYSLTGTAPYMKALYIAAIALSVLFGIFEFAVQGSDSKPLAKVRHTVSLCLSAASVLLFIAGLQPYAAVTSFAFMIIKLLSSRRKA